MLRTRENSDVFNTLIYVVIYFNVTFAYLLLSSILIVINLNNAIPKHGLRKRAIPGKSSKANVIYSRTLKTQHP